VWVAGYDNNVFVQVGLIMLVGLAAKNAILIVEFAKMRREAGASVEDAALEAAKLRFRPILMTAFAFIMGVVPLMLASGAGAACAESNGHGGVLRDARRTVVGVFLIPGLFAMVERMGFRKKSQRVAVPSGLGAPPVTPAPMGAAPPGGH
jgi:HAE1 family hydrophobic/amphiphilic exporter-1/multidrug efflux pump